MIWELAGRTDKDWLHPGFRHCCLKSCKLALHFPGSSSPAELLRGSSWSKSRFTAAVCLPGLSSLMYRIQTSVGSYSANAMGWTSPKRHHDPRCPSSVDWLFWALPDCKYRTPGNLACIYFLKGPGVVCDFDFDSSINMDLISFTKKIKEPLTTKNRTSAL